MDEAQPLGARGVLLADPKLARSDVRMIERAVRERWIMPEGAFTDLPAAMLEIVTKESIKVLDREGVAVEIDNDREKIAAARVLAVLEAQNQADEHHSDKLHQDDKHLAVDMVAALAQQSREQKEALIRRAGLGHLLEAPSPSPTNK